MDREQNCKQDSTSTPKCPRPDLALGIKLHAHGSGITLVLLVESVKGLQFLKDGRWYKAPIIPEALLVNVGDLAEFKFDISNGMFKSPVNRVVTNSEQERISLAGFYLPDPKKEIEPFEGLIDEPRPRLYRKVKNYDGIYFQYYRHGRRPTESAKIEA